LLKFTECGNRRDLGTFFTPLYLVAEVLEWGERADMDAMAQFKSALFQWREEWEMDVRRRRELLRKAAGIGNEKSQEVMKMFGHWARNKI
jgi:hypothetical protein